MDARASLRPNTSPSVPTPDEALLVGLRFVPRAKQPAIDAFIRLLRQAGDLADNPSRSPAHRIALLEELAIALDIGKLEPPLASPPTPAAERAEDAPAAQTVRALAEAAPACDLRHLHHILQACRQDVSKTRYRDWNELLAYCRYGAAPVGPFVLEIFGEEKSGQTAAEALCCALRVLTMLRDCGRDYRERGRVYLPERWFKEAGADMGALAGEAADASLRRVFAMACDAAERLLATAQPLPRFIADRRLRAAAAATLFVTVRFGRRMRRADPLASTVMPTRGDRLMALAYGRWRALRRL